MKKILFYVVIFIVLHLLVVLNVNNIPIEQLNFPLKENPKDYFPFILYPLAGFDGAHYILIAKSGYGQFQQAFFPFYPLLINALSKLAGVSVLLLGLTISWVTLVLGIIFFEKFAKFITGNNDKLIWSIVFLLAFPSSFFYVAIYPESLFLFLSCACLYFIFSKRYLAASIFAVLSSLTKIQGALLIIPFILSALELNQFSTASISHQIKANYKKLIFALSPIYGLLIYSFYLAKTYGDPFAFYHVQEAFGAERTSQGIILLPQVLFRYAKILTTANINFQYWIALLELSIFLIVFTVLLFELYKIMKNRTKNFNYLSINLYSIAILILPTLTGTLSSIPRYALLSYGFFIALVKIKSNAIKILITIIFGFLHIVLFVFFIKGHFVS